MMDQSLSYDEAIDAFIATNVPQVGNAGVVAAYRAVQALPYYSGPDRTPQAALRDGRGACTAKHLLLRDVLRRMGQVADVEIVEGDFASGIPLHGSMPDELQDIIRDADVTDFHCRVRLEGPNGPQNLDATWPLYLAAYGFPVEDQWDGQGDTRQAIAKVIPQPLVDDVLCEKARLLKGLEEARIDRRARFLALLSNWLNGLVPPSQ